MPNRIVRENILTSDKMPKLTWAEEVFYRRLMSVVDDYGRFDGRHEIIRARLYPLQLDKVGTPDIDKWIRACVEADLVREYTVAEGKPVILILRFGQPLRSPSKYGDPPPESICAQMKSFAPLSVSVSESVSVFPPTPRERGESAVAPKARKPTRAERKLAAEQQAEEARKRKLEADRLAREQAREGVVSFSEAAKRNLIKPLKGKTA